MAYVYILQSERNQKYYIGSTANLQQRIKSHISGHEYATKRLGPVKLVFSQLFFSIDHARKIELRLKKLKRRDYIEKIILQGYISAAPTLLNNKKSQEVGVPTERERASGLA